jgi:hypothetical protein
MNRKPKCIIITGRPGAGKTTLAKKLGERLSMPVISRDEIKEGYVNTYGVKHDQLPPDTNGLSPSSARALSRPSTRSPRRSGVTANPVQPEVHGRPNDSAARFPSSVSKIFRAAALLTWPSPLARRQSATKSGWGHGTGIALVCVTTNR